MHVAVKLEVEVDVDIEVEDSDELLLLVPVELVENVDAEVAVEVLDVVAVLAVVRLDAEVVDALEVEVVELVLALVLVLVLVHVPQSEGHVSDAYAANLGVMAVAASHCSGPRALHSTGSATPWHSALDVLVVVLVETLLEDEVDEVQELHMTGHLLRTCSPRTDTTTHNDSRLGVHVAGSSAPLHAGDVVVDVDVAVEVDDRVAVLVLLVVAVRVLVDVLVVGAVSVPVDVLVRVVADVEVLVLDLVDVVVEVVVVQVSHITGHSALTRVAVSGDTAVAGSHCRSPNT